MKIEDLKVGDVICHRIFDDRTIQYIGVDVYVFIWDNGEEGIRDLSEISHWKIKQPEAKKKILYAYRSSAGCIYFYDIEQNVYNRAPEYDIVYPVGEG